MYNYFMYGMFPYIPDEKYLRPPLLYDIMNSIVNFNNDNPVKISELSQAARTTIFDFDYVLSENITKADFETLILDKFTMRRLGYETYTAWKIALKVKLREILPYYNKLFDALGNWNIFTSGESGTRSKAISGNTELDNRYSKLPQNEINNVKNGTYMTDYTLGQNTSSGTEYETYARDNNNKIDAYIKYVENKNKIMSLIFEDLDSLFYGLAN